MRGLVLALVLGLLTWPAAADVPLRLGHGGGVSQELAEQVRVGLQGTNFHVSLAGPAAPGGSAQDLDLVRATLAGDFQLAWVRASALANFDRAWGLLTVPYLWEDLGQARQFMRGEALLQATRGRGLRALAAVDLGDRFFASRQPLRDLSELRGRSVGAPRNRFCLDFLAELGARPAAPGRELEACETSAADLALWGPGLSHLLLSQHGLEYAVLVVNERAAGRLQSAELASLLKLKTRLRRPTLPPCQGRLLPGQERQRWRERLAGLRGRCLALVGAPWKELLP